MAKPRYNSIDLFAGCGGLSLGLESAGFMPVMFSELDKDTRESFKSNVSHSSDLIEIGNVKELTDNKSKILKTHLKNLKKNPKIRFKLIGHICCGDKERPHLDLKNVRTGENNLSEARAKSLYNYLVKRGINKRRMRYVGMAYRQPTGKGDQFDRRVEIEITHIDN